MENLVHDLPIAVDFEQREQIGVVGTAPVVEFEPHCGDRANDVDAGDACLQPRRRAILVIPGKELLDRAGEQVGAGITEDRRVLMKGGLHVVAPSGLGAIDVVLDDLADRVMLEPASRDI